MRGAAAFVEGGRRTTHKCYNLSSTVEMLTTRDGPTVIDAKARYWSRIAILAYRHLHSRPLLHNVRYGKTTVVWLPDGEKILKIYLFVSTECTNVTDGQAVAARRHRPRLCIASRGKTIEYNDADWRSR